LLRSRPVATAPLWRNVGRFIGRLGTGTVLFTAGCAGRSPPAQAPSQAAESPRPQSESPSGRSERTYGWLSVGIGAEAAVLAVGTSLLMLHDKSVRDGNCNAQKLCSEAGLDANKDIALLGGWNAGAWIVAAAGLGVGGYLLWRDPVEGEKRAAITLDPMGTGLGLGVRSRF